ncbi:hypothetical protein J437_LFUL017589 [Ladona fulva]|uniref:Uncharacterized protein n=1 Tax=Ladona fulva TaxID=123851 RepID=A0A8K0KR26_LADFU|nr:hypothetical protein J437_LFUL017589 [Ladona fulva]
MSLRKKKVKTMLSLEKVLETVIWQEIISLIEENRVVVVTGEAGCGKSTQVPQFILDDWAAHGLGGFCNIVVTQPRRISATSLAERVSHERLEREENHVKSVMEEVT